ncbi:MAG: hypothetical protein R3359_09825 [Marinirhabdus sp.]|nr:hypothetical protein [Marinirhabdus sp.]
MKNFDAQIVIVRGKKPWYEMLFPFACFCIALLMFWDGVETAMAVEQDRTGILLGWSFAALIFIVLGTVFGMVRDYHFDFKRKRYKIVKRVGSIGFGTWKPFKNVDYVSVFENPDAKFQVNLWYDSNKHFHIDTFANSATAISFAIHIAQQLQIELHNGVDHQCVTDGRSTQEKIQNEKRKIDAYFTEGRRPLWHTLVAGLSFLAAIVIVYASITEFQFGPENIESPLRSLDLVVLLIGVGVKFSMINDYLFDLENNQFRVIHNIGLIRWGKWRNLKSIDYISVFQKKEGLYLVNLWYNTNKHITITGSHKLDAAMEMGGTISKQLHIDLLDASDPHNTKWVELSE